MKFGIGQSVRRTEDIRFITGHGEYTDDMRFDNETHVAFHRTPQAHAKIKSIDVSAACKAPGVVAVLTWEDVEAAGAGPMPCLAPLRNRDGSPVRQSPKPLLAKDRVTFTGEAVAMIVAETYAQAVDAALAQLPDEWRVAVVLRDLEGLSTREAAEIVGVRQAAFKSRLHRGRMQLRALLEPYVEPEES